MFSKKHFILFNMSEKLVSIIVPIYNGSYYVNNCINHLINQSYKKIEIIIINDASTDNTFLKIKKFKDKRIKIFNNKKNIGVAQCLNKGLKLCKGGYIALNDVDDLSQKNRIEEELKFLKKNKNVHLVASFIKIKTLKKKIITRIIPHHSNLLKFYSIFNNYFTPSTFLFKREIYKKYKIKFRKQCEPSHDFDFISQLYRKKLKLEIIRKPLVIYQERINSLSKRNKKNAFLNVNLQIVPNNILYYLKNNNYKNEANQIANIINKNKFDIEKIELNKLIKIIKICFYKTTKKKYDLSLYLFILKFIFFAYRLKYKKTYLISKYLYKLLKNKI